MLRSFVWLSLSLLAAAMATAHAAEPSHEKVECSGARYEYLLQTASAKAPRPALLLLHGAGGTPGPMIDAWRKKAEAEGIVLIAPAVPRDLKFEDAAPAVFHCVVEDAARQAKIDREKIYLFGYSMGGYLAFDGAMFDSEFYAGAAIFANGIADEYSAILEKARRKIPIALYVGNRDRVYPIAQVRKTHELLEKHGYTVQYLEIGGADHNYFAVADRINEDSWKFLAEHPLSDSPRPGAPHP